jgi:DNA repair exonuclease SbcCD ATPase subunit
VRFRAEGRGRIKIVARRRCLERYEQFRREYELAHEQMRAERHAERERCLAELDVRYERLVGELDASREEQGREFASVAGGLANGRQVMREILLEIRDDRKALARLRSDLADIGDGVRANTHGLLRVLDELRREDGPSAAGA